MLLIQLVGASPEEAVVRPSEGIGTGVVYKSEAKGGLEFGLLSVLSGIAIRYRMYRHRGLPEGRSCSFRFCS